MQFILNYHRFLLILSGFIWIKLKEDNEEGDDGDMETEEENDENDEEYSDDDDMSWKVIPISFFVFFF